MKKVAGKLRLELAQFRELQSFAQFASDLDEETKSQIERGKRVVEVLKQDQYKPMEVINQVAILFAVSNGYLDEVEIEKIKEFEEKLSGAVSQDPNFNKLFVTDLYLTNRVEKALRVILEKVKKDFVSAISKGN